ncbi:penicillin-insensitive murein endopeptidase [Shigella flexneri]
MVNTCPTLWKPEIGQLIKLAAEDREVTRIFVNPAIKQTALPRRG